LSFENRADANDKNDDKGKTVLESVARLVFSAISNENTEVVSLLLKNGADVNAKDNAGRKALMCATQHNKPEIISILKQYGAK
jgi:ankyrin repeat protein